jgi:hypothetical protein
MALVVVVTVLHLAASNQGGEVFLYLTSFYSDAFHYEKKMKNSF